MCWSLFIKIYGMRSNTHYGAAVARKSSLIAQQVTDFLGYSGAKGIKSLSLLWFYHSWISYPHVSFIWTNKISSIPQSQAVYENMMTLTSSTEHRIHRCGPEGSCPASIHFPALKSVKTSFTKSDLSWLLYAAWLCFLLPKCKSIPLP